jgi:hypothetical protein
VTISDERVQQWASMMPFDYPRPTHFERWHDDAIALARQVITLREIAEEAVAGWASWAFDEGSEKEKALVNILRDRLAALDAP